MTLSLGIPFLSSSMRYFDICSFHYAVSSFSNCCCAYTLSHQVIPNTCYNTYTQHIALSSHAPIEFDCAFLITKTLSTLQQHKYLSHCTPERMNAGFLMYVILNFLYNTELHTTCLILVCVVHSLIIRKTMAVAEYELAIH